MTPKSARIPISIALCGLLVWFSQSLLPLGGEPSLKENLDLPYDALSSVVEEEEAPEIVVFYGQVWEADAFIFVLPTTITMMDYGEMDRAMAELRHTISDLSPRAEFGIVCFDETVRKFPVGSRPVAATDIEKQQGIEFVDRQQISQRDVAHLKDALFMALELAEGSSKRRKAIVYVGDGSALRWDQEQGSYCKEVLQSVRSRNVQKVRIDCLHTYRNNEGFTALFLQELARSNFGRYFRID